MEQLTELGFYGLAGHSATPRDLLTEVARAEEIGLGSVFVSERFNTKDACALSGAAGAVSSTLGIATAATNHNTRHVLVTATFGTTMHRLTDGRFTLGLGRGFDMLFDVMGVPRVTMAQLEDVIGLLRRLWHGEAIMGHDGPAGRFPVPEPGQLVRRGHPDPAHRDRRADARVRRLPLPTRSCCTRSSPTRRSPAASPRSAAARSRPVAIRQRCGCGRCSRPSATTSTRSCGSKLVGRLGTYLQGYGDLLVRVNGWDPAVLESFRGDDVVKGVGGALDAVATPDELRHIATLLPAEWLAASATGTPAQCARRVLDQFDAGADSVILHGATPDELAPVVEAYRAVRPIDRFPSLPANPGGAHAFSAR